ncbi:hypothetical protein TNCV_5074491 [Trichonephila clavipes]|nr:hypothetical protein TNCV_5074491 [Trichonephila clavipes]
MRMTHFNRLDASLRWRDLGRLEAGQSQAELALRARRQKWATVPELVCDLLMGLEEDIPAGNTGNCGAEKISCGHHKNDGMFFSMTSRNVLDKVFLVESSPGEKIELAFIPPMKKNRCGGNGIFVCGGIMLGSCTPLYSFYVGTVNSQCYTNEILEVHVRWFISCFGPGLHIYGR